MNLENKQVKIQGKSIFLKNLTSEQASEDYCGWLNDQEVNQYLETRSTTIDQLKRYIETKNRNQDCLFLGIFLKKNKKHIGNVKFEPIDFENKKARIGILIGDKNYWGRGIGTEAVTLLVDYGFSELDLEIIDLGVISENKPAIRVYQKIGFHIDKVEEKAIRHSNQLFDRLLMSIKKLELNKGNR